MNKLSRIAVKAVLCFAILCVALLGPDSATNRAKAYHPELQFDSAINQCAQGTWLLLQGQIGDARALLEAGYQQQQDQTAPRTGPFDPCSIFLGLLYIDAGDLALARQIYEAELARLGPTGDEQIRWTLMAGIGSIYIRQGEYDDAWQIFTEAQQIVDNPDPAQTWTSPRIKTIATALTYHSLGFVQTATAVRAFNPDHRGYEPARENFQIALDILQTMNRQPSAVTSPLDMMLDSLAPSLNLSESDLAMLRMFLQVSGVSAGESADDLATLQMVLPLLQSFLGGDQVSTEEMVESVILGMLDQILSSVARGFEPIALNNMGETYRGQAAALEATQGADPERISALYGDALTYYDRAFASIQPVEPSLFSAAQSIFNLGAEATVYNNRALVYWAQGDAEAALTGFEHALTILEDELGNDLGAANTHANIAYIHQQANRLDEAIEHYEQALDTFDTVRAVAESSVVQINADSNSGLTGALPLQGTVAQFSDVYALTLSAYLQADRARDAFDAAERGRARLFLDMMATGPRLSDEDAQRLAAVQEAFVTYQWAKNTASQTEIGQNDLLGSILVPRMAEQLEASKAAYEMLIAELRNDNEQLAALIPGATTTLSIQQIQQQLLDEKSTLIIYYTTEDRLAQLGAGMVLAWVIDRDNVNLVSLDTTDGELRNSIDNLRNLIEHTPNLSDSARPDELTYLNTAVAGPLYSQLIEPLRPYIQHDNLIIVPHGVLHYLPFAALWNNDTGRYLIEDYAISYAPSASSLKFIQQNRNPNETRALLLGNPDGSLPHAEAEVSAISTLYNTVPLTRTMATETLVVSQSQQSDVLHLAAHANYTFTAPLSTTVALAADAQNDGNLTVSEVFGLDLAEANLVVLSACKTALGEQSRGDEITGLTRAFLYAGTPSLVTTLWNVDDVAATPLMTSFHQHLNEGQSPTAALRTAQLAALRDGRWPSPYYWAPYSLHGDAASLSDSGTPAADIPAQTDEPDSPPAETATAILEVLVNRLNVRSGPGIANTRIGQLQEGDQVEIVGQKESGTWWQVCCVDGEVGWVINNVNFVRVLDEAEPSE